MAGLFGYWDWNGQKKNPWNSKTREINDALRAIGFNPKQRHKPNIGLLFGLAQWGQRQRTIPKKSLRNHLDDGHLFEVLRIYDQVPRGAYGLCDLDQVQLNALEKRLNQYWHRVMVMIEAMNAPKNALRKQNQIRRKHAHIRQKPLASMLSATLVQLNS